jgi:hypothetical protein
MHTNPTFCRKGNRIFESSVMGNAMVKKSWTETSAMLASMTVLSLSQW